MTTENPDSKESREQFIARMKRAAVGGAVQAIAEVEQLPVLVLTVGFPYSGKSTWAREQGCPIVSPDAVRLAVHGQRYIQEAEPYVWMLARHMVQALFLAGHDRVIVDATNNTKERREAWRSSKWRLAVQNFPAGADECKRRAAEEHGDDEIVPVIERMAAAHEPPDEFQDGGG